ncbi:MAG TPA: hypothetical protein PLX97_04350, partial [Gemmatales bacterium]|nr:hypothetical protein [Gemmatales bacterium]
MEKKFYTQFLWTWIVISVITWVMVLLIEIIQHQRMPEWEDLGIIAGYSVGITAGLLVVAIPLFPVIIRPTGVSTYNFWGIYSTVAWEDLHDVRAVNIL